MDPMKQLATYLYGCAPTSALTCSIEGDPPSDAGGSPAPQPSPAPAQPASQPQFTPEQLAWIKDETTRASNAAAAAARRAEQERLGRRGGEQPQAQAQPNNPSPPAPAPAGVVDSDALNDALAEYPFDRDQRQEIRAAARREGAGDLDTFVAKWGRMFGKAKATATPATPAGNNGAPQGGASPAPTSAAPAGPMPASSAPSRVLTADTPLHMMTPAERVAFVKQKGVHEFKAKVMRELADSGLRVSLRR